ncbi:MAG: chorismate-binding protein, partial [Desulfobacterota bacterium]|nr:chorismate-binding protein [Thermodesulfobacteriota bacterium]
MKRTPIIFPDFREFNKLIRQGNLIPVYYELRADTETPVSAFMKLKSSRNCFLLESVEGGEKWARYSFIGLNPSMIIASKGTDVTVVKGRRRQHITSDNPLTVLRTIMRSYRPVPVAGLPRFFGGAVGYVGYDMVRFFERLPVRTQDSLGWHDAYFMITDTLVIFDNIKHNLKIVVNVYVDETTTSPAAAYERARTTIARIIEQLNKPLPKSLPRQTYHRVSVTSNMQKKTFLDMVAKARQYIRAGDIIQVVLSQRFATPLRTDPFELYRALRVVNPSPYMYFMQLHDAALVGSSPEVLVRLERNE